MRFLPVVGREIRVASRRRGTYRNRFFAALVALGLESWIFLVASASTTNPQMGQILFRAVAGFAFVYCLLIGIGVTSDCVSEEKREGTLGLLFLTDLKGYDVVLGKLAATSLNSFYGLLAIVPVLTVPLLLGSVVYGEIWRTALVLASLMFFSLSVGMFVSTISRHQRKAAALTFLLVLMVQGLPPLTGAMLAFKQGWRAVPMEFLVPSAGSGFALANDMLYQTYPDSYWTSVGVTHGLGWLFLVAASVAVTRAWQDRATGLTARRWEARWQRWGEGERSLREAYRRRLLDVTPYFWVAARKRLKPAFVFLFLGLAAVVWTWLRTRYRDVMLDPMALILTGYLLQSALKVWLASEACRSLAEDRRSGSLELILSTPLPVPDLIRGQMLALMRQFGWPAALLLAADVLLFVAGRQQTFSADGDTWMMLFVIGMTMFVADLYALSWVAMWLGVVTRRSNRAMGGAIGRILVLPWVVYFGMLTAIGLLNPPGFTPTANFFLMSWLIIGLANNALFVVWARSNLLERLRVVVTESLQKRPRPGPVGRLWGRA